MSSSHAAKHAPEPDGFDMLDGCHQNTVFALGKLSALVSRLDTYGVDDEARAMATEVVRFFSDTSRQHHEDEERHLFPRLAAGGDPQTVEAVLRLQQDHDWLEEDWMELAPHLDAVACGQSWFDLDLLREGVEVFVALSRDHMALEESLIYPQARAQIGPAERREMGREMAARRRGRHKAQPSGAAARV